jgi:inorganic pyrophosphatase
MTESGSGQFFAAIAEIVRTSPGLVVERPRGTAHPRIPDAIYPLDYGHLSGTSSGDGAEIDVFVGSAAGVGVTAVLLTADVQKRDTEIKVLLDCTPNEATVVRAFLSDVLEIGGHLVERE